MVRVVHERASRREDARQVEARIAEGRDGVEDGEPQAARESEVRDEDRRHERRPEELESDRPPEDDAQDPHEAADLRRGHRLLERAPLHEADVPPGEDRQHHGERHHAHAARLDEQEDHQLAEERPVRAGVHRDEARDAHRGHRREERVQEVRSAPVRGEGQHEEQRPRRDGRRKAHRDDLKGR